jgi:hypothetical protein
MNPPAQGLRNSITKKRGSYNNNFRDSVSSRRTSTESRGSGQPVSFIRAFIGFRRQDYHSDVNLAEGMPPPRAPVPTLATGAASVAAPPGFLQASQAQRDDLGAYTFWQRMRNARLRRSLFASVLGNSVWKGVLIAYASILLFGGQCRELFIPPKGDTAVDGVLLLALAFFVVDIAMRCDAEDNYFPCVRHKKFCYSFGSFLFWCDFWSTLTLLFDVSIISKDYFTESHYDIELGPYGIPVSRPC